MARFIVGAFIILLGISMLTGVAFFHFFFAAVLILVGLRILLGKESKVNFGGQTTTGEEFFNDVAIFSSVNKAIKTENFKGGKVVVIFAGGQIDLSQARATESVVEIEAVAIFGGLKLIVPKDWRVNSKGVAILGGFDNKTGSEATGPTLNLKGVAIFGGVEIVS